MHLIDKIVPHGMSATNIQERTGPDGTHLIDPGRLRLLHCYEMWTETLDAFAFWALLWTDGEDYFHYRYPSRWDLPTDEHKTALIPLATKVPKSCYRPQIPSDIYLTPASLPLSDNIFVKMSEPIEWDPEKPESTSLAETVIHEARTCETIGMHGPHRNVCEYRGYIRKDGLITGLCYRRYEKTLDVAVRDGDPIDAQAILSGIKCGLEHLHSIGIVHVRFALDCFMMATRADVFIVI